VEFRLKPDVKQLVVMVATARIAAKYEPFSRICQVDIYTKKLANSQNELCELFEFIVREELNLLT